MKSALVFLLASVAALSLQAQTLTQALEQAWARDPRAATFAPLGAQAQAGLTLAGALTAGPGVVSIGNTSDRLNARRGKQEWEVEFALPLWRPGQKERRVTEAERAQVDLAASLVAHRLQLAGDLRAAWWSLALARNQVALAEAQVQSAQALEEDVRRRVAAGDLARIDANLAQSETLTAQGEALAAQTERRAAEQAWQLLTGLDAPSALMAEAPRNSESGDEHPMIAQALAQSRLATARLRSTEASSADAPEIALRMVRERGDFNEGYANVVGVKLSIPLPSGARTAVASAEQRAALAKADAELSLARQQVTVQVARARTDLAATARELTWLRQRAALAADTATLAEKSFALGEFDLATVLRARAALIDVRKQVERQDLRASSLQSQLHQALGLLP